MENALKHLNMLMLSQHYTFNLAKSEGTTLQRTFIIRVVSIINMYFNILINYMDLGMYRGTSQVVQW